MTLTLTLYRREQALVECIEGFCKCGDRCDNMRIQRGVMPPTQLVDCGRKGLGLKLLENVKAGSFVGEYMGEIVTEQEYYMRRVVRVPVVVILLCAELTEHWFLPPALP